MGGGASVRKKKDFYDSESSSGDESFSSSSGAPETQAGKLTGKTNEPPCDAPSHHKKGKSPGRKKKLDCNKKKKHRNQHRKHRAPKKQGSMGKLEIVLKSAILIQRWYRQYLARIEIRRRYTWNIFQTIEYAGEQDQMQLYTFFTALLKHIPQKSGIEICPGKIEQGGGSSDSRSASPGGESSSSDADLTKGSSSCVKLRKRKVFNTEGSGMDIEQIHIESDYKGPHVKLPMTLQNLQEIIDTLKRKKSLHVKYVAMILRVAAANFKLRPNFNQPSTALSKQITIVGDLHGKLDDLLVIFYKNGLPSAENPYVFNGDYVDRGKRSMEILLTLLVCFLYSPDGTFLNRGNHEDHIMNMRYGFIREVKLKYKVFASKILHLIDQVFRSLPLGSIIDNRVLVVHGGISADTDLKVISGIDRHKFVSILRPPVVETMDESGHIVQLSELYSSNNGSEWKQVLDLLWSDPQSGNGCSANTFRGGGSYFGADVTETVLKKHDLQMLIRSHECKPDGYEFMHENKCLTIFSASNYYEEGSNKGAYVRLLGGPREPLEPYFVQFNAATPKLRSMTMRQRVGLVEASALKELRSTIRRKQELLNSLFIQHDIDGKGLISLSNWCDVLEEGTGLKLPWRLLRLKLADVDKETGMVEYATTFKKEGENSSQDGISVAEALYGNKSSLEAIFRIIDKDNSGYISMEEFSEACDLLGKHLPSPIPHTQMIEMANSMDLNKDGFIDLNEFLETFRIVTTEHDRDESLEYEEVDE